MIEAPTLALAFAAGLVSFLSPCCLPLVPGYLAAVSGTSPAELSRRRFDPQVLARSFVFVATFSAIFIVLGLTATAAGAFVFKNQPLLHKVAGGLIIAMGLLFLASLVMPRLNRQWHPDALMRKAGNGGPMVAGAAFAIAWTPCIGPTLAAILGLAATSEGTGRGALLLAAYSAGLGVPFLLTAAAFNTATGTFGFFKRHYRAIQGTAGIVLVGMGILVVTGQLFRLNIEAQQFLDRYGLNFFQNL